MSNARPFMMLLVYSVLLVPSDGDESFEEAFWNFERIRSPSTGLAFHLEQRG